MFSTTLKHLYLPCVLCKPYHNGKISKSKNLLINEQVFSYFVLFLFYILRCTVTALDFPVNVGIHGRVLLVCHGCLKVNIIKKFCSSGIQVVFIVTVVNFMLCPGQKYDKIFFPVIDFQSEWIIFANIERLLDKAIYSGYFCRTLLSRMLERGGTQ